MTAHPTSCDGEIQTSPCQRHPRPQLARQDWIDLNGQWQFAFDPANVGMNEGWATRPEVFDYTIEVPFPPESPASGINQQETCPVIWYRRLLDLSSVRSRRLLLHFAAIDYRADVWVNGQHVVTHEGGYTPFTTDITAYVEREEGQVLVVRVLDDPGDLSQPRGKQFWGATPRGIWQHRTSGIWQQVWLEPLPATHISEVTWTSDPHERALVMQVAVHAAGDRPLRLHSRLEVHGECIGDDVVAVTQPVVVRRVPMPAEKSTATTPPKYSWSPEHPNLVHVTFTLLDGDVELDRASSYTGYRTLRLAGGLFFLNDIQYFLRLVLTHGYWPASHLAVPSLDALEAEAVAVKELGFNGVRVHQKVEDPRFLQFCDEIGLLVFAEMPAAYSFTRDSVFRFAQQWSEVIRRDYSHPCLVAWVPFNEGWGLPEPRGAHRQRSFLRCIYEMTRVLDPTRPVITNSGQEALETDIVAIHDYAQDPNLLESRYSDFAALRRTLNGAAVPSAGARAYEAERPVILNECGGASLPPERWRDRVYGYGLVRSGDALLVRYEALLSSISRSTALAGFCYTQLADVEFETNGLLRADRTPKVDPATVREVTRRPSASNSVEALMALIREATGYSSEAAAEGFRDGSLD